MQSTWTQKAWLNLKKQKQTDEKPHNTELQSHFYLEGALMEESLRPMGGSGKNTQTK